MKNTICRNRKVYFILISCTVLMGLLSRSSIVPTIILPYLGDFLYALLFFFITGFVLKEKSSICVSSISVVYCYLIEFLQLYQADWINAVRSFKLGGLLLGYGFLWSDIVAYTLAGIAGLFGEFYLIGSRYRSKIE